MPRYEVNKDGADEALAPQGGNPTVTFNGKDITPERKKSNTKKIVIWLLVAVCIIIILLLCAWFIYTIVDTRPEKQKDNFHIEVVPGERYRPEQHMWTIINFNHTNPNSYRKWVDDIQTELQDYTDTSPTNRVNCDYDRPPDEDEVCAQDISKWFPCIQSNNYGYHKASPCVFVRFNKIVDWIPEFYDTTTSLPEAMPDNLKNTIKREQQLFSKLGRTVWLSCGGMEPSDEEHAGTIRYIPRMGFPGYFFPYNKTENYLSPLVALYFEKPTKGVVINIECRVWARNIRFDKEKNSGYVNFQLMIDN